MDQLMRVLDPQDATSPASQAVAEAQLRQQIHSSSQSLRTCWVCLGDEVAESPSSQAAGTSSPAQLPPIWVHPCRCNGLDAHHACLLRWVAERRASHPDQPVRCPACLHVYAIDEEVDLVAAFVAGCDRAVRLMLPYATFTALSATLYIMSTAYGAYAIVATCGPELADAILNDDGVWASRTWIGLPMIPFALVASRLDIADNVLPVLPFLILSNNHPIEVAFPPSPTVTLCMLPWARAVYKETWRLIYHFTLTKASSPSISTSASVFAPPSPRVDTTVGEGETAGGAPTGFPPPAIPRRPGAPTFLPRLLMGSLLLPAVASFAGAVLGLFPAVRRALPNVFLRSVVGGSIVILARDMVLYWDFVRRLKRVNGAGKRIRDFVKQ
ncbi:hypothetical protein BC830DRAFT_1088700 [Chytriomyces sp. MP71]|nr:hypothetical protein BC830DRAFT_1088700 [Chytriomyces sp. MP71]